LLCFALVDPGWSDIPLYQRYAEAALSGKVPYVDFGVEYPPLAPLLFVVAGVLSNDVGGFAVCFKLLMCLFDVGCLLLLASLARNICKYGSRKILVVEVAYIVLTTLSFQVLYDRFDIVVAFLVLLALHQALVLKRLKTTYTVIWLAAFLKIFPVLLMPLFLVFHMKTVGNTKKVLAEFAASAAVLLGLVFLSAISFGNWWTKVFAYHKQRGIQIESIYSSIAYLGRLFGVPLGVSHDFGAYNVRSSFTPLMSQVAAVLVVTGIVFVWATSVRASIGRPKRESDGVDLIISVAALLSVFILLNKVLSPQFLIWLHPFLALLLVRSGRWPAIGVLWFWVSVATATLFPYDYAALVALKPRAEVLLLARNVALAAVTVFLIREQGINCSWPGLRARIASARSSRRGHRRGNSPATRGASAEDG
jgi:hypothetical protein